MTDRRTRVRRWFREPLLHFVLIGCALFVANRALHPDSTRPTPVTRIELTADSVHQLELSWLAQWERRPTAAEMRGLVESKVREEILSREAAALGLDKDDTIIKRRLAQKMEFLAEDVSFIRDPTREELAAWYERNGDRFRLPDRISFHHLYFSFDRRGDRARDDAMFAAAALARHPADDAFAPSADTFIFQDHYADRSQEQVAALFGTKFAEAVLAMPAGSWRGPIESGFGWHVVWVESIEHGRVPVLEEIEPDVRTAWIDAQRAENRRRVFDEMRARYEVVLPLGDADASTGDTTALTKAGR